MVALRTPHEEKIVKSCLYDCILICKLNRVKCNQAIEQGILLLAQSEIGRLLSNDLAHFALLSLSLLSGAWLLLVIVFRIAGVLASG